jgi:preprotein translocase subunit YajC
LLSVFQIEGVMTVILAQQSGGGGLFGLLPLLIIGVLFYFMLIRPQQKRARDQRQLVDSLSVGDKVITIGGFHGTVRSVDESTVRLELNPSTVVTLSKQAIARRVVEPEAGTESDQDADSEEVTEE